MDTDTYRTIAAPAEAVLRERGSRFLAYAYPVKDEKEVKERLDALRKQYYNATHHCYAWRIRVGEAGGQTGGLAGGQRDTETRVNDDGEPSGTAGKPILGQVLSAELTDILIVVVRYFGGTKLGVPGLIGAYRESARAVIEAAEVVTKTVNAVFRVRFAYAAMNDVMRVVKEMSPDVVSQNFDNVCEMELSIRRGLEEQFRGRLEKCEGAEIEFLEYR